MTQFTDFILFFLEKQLIEMTRGSAIIAKTQLGKVLQ